jgi:hypothetical protein
MQNLVIVRAGDNSLHRNWLKPHPNFDLYISYYGDKHGRFQEDAIRYEIKKGPKWKPLDELIQRDWNFISQYQYVALIDDDILATSREINGVFRVGKHLGFDMFQPALTHDSYLNWVQTRREDDKDIVARTINTVEQMAVFFTIEFLARVKNTFGYYKTGWGLEAHWQSRLSHPQFKAGIIDKFPVKHTQLCGSSQMYEFYKSEGIDYMEDLNNSVKTTGIKCWEYQLYQKHLTKEIETLI